MAYFSIQNLYNGHYYSNSNGYGGVHYVEQPYFFEAKCFADAVTKMWYRRDGEFPRALRFAGVDNTANTENQRLYIWENFGGTPIRILITRQSSQV